ncbi:predicted protein, partial [Nematostella vectensis]
PHTCTTRPGPRLPQPHAYTTGPAPGSQDLMHTRQAWPQAPTTSCIHGRAGPRLPQPHTYTAGPAP